jgi:hypothetical protein
MALRDSLAVKVSAGVLVGLALIGFFLRIWLKVSSGHALDAYLSGTMVTWTYGSAFVTMVVFVFVGAFVCIVKLVQWFRRKGSR